MARPPRHAPILSTKHCRPPAARAVRAGGNKLVLADPSSLTQGPPEDVLTFLSNDPPEAAAALANGGANGSEGGAGRSESLGLASVLSGSQGGLLSKQKSLAHVSGVSELWLVDWSELELLKQIGEGSFGKVHLAKWRETTVGGRAGAQEGSRVVAAGLETDTAGHRFGAQSAGAAQRL